MAVSRWAVLDGSKKVVNVVLWDGETDWRPPEGCTVVADDGTAAIGGRHDGSKFLAPAPKPEDKLTELERRLTALGG